MNRCLRKKNNPPLPPQMFFKSRPATAARPPRRVSVNESMNQPFRTLHALLIPEATNREPKWLIEVATEDNAVVVVQEAVPGV